MKTHNRREFNSVGSPKVPKNPTAAEIAQYLIDRAGWEKLQPFGRTMDAREWAATCLEGAAERIKQSLTK